MRGLVGPHDVAERRDGVAQRVDGEPFQRALQRRHGDTVRPVPGQSGQTAGLLASLMVLFVPSTASGARREATRRVMVNHGLSV